MSFKKAVRSQVKIKIALTGVSGSGKTYSALLIAKGLTKSGKIALIDTENRSASLYSDLVSFDVLDLTAPYTIEKYTNAINEAIKAGYDVVIVDSLSHAWKQLLADKEQVDSKGGNSFTNWSKFTPKHEAFINALTQSEIHLIGTMRSKTEYVIEQNEKGRATPRKMGLAPVQRDGMEYEFGIVFDIAAPTHLCETSKDRTSLFDGKTFMPTVETGLTIREWLDNGAVVIKTESPLPKGDFVKAEEMIGNCGTLTSLKLIEQQLNLRAWTDEERTNLNKCLLVKEELLTPREEETDVNI